MKVLRVSTTNPARDGLVARRIILAETHQDFVTWQQNPLQAGRPVYFGHYFPKREKGALEAAELDFQHRLEEGGYREVGIQFYGPRSRCTCGHVGDGPESNHRDGFQAGHGACIIEGCDCRKFTWDHFLPVFEAWQEAWRETLK